MTDKQPKDLPPSDQGAPGQPGGRASLTPDDLLLVSGLGPVASNPAEVVPRRERSREAADGHGGRRVGARAGAAGGDVRPTTVDEARTELDAVEAQPAAAEVARGRFAQEPPEVEGGGQGQADAALDAEELPVEQARPRSVAAAATPLGDRLAGWRPGPRLPSRFGEPVRRPLSEARLRDLPRVRLSTDRAPACWVSTALSLSVVVGGVALAAWVLDQWRDPVLAGLAVSASVTLAALLWFWKRR